MSPRDRAIAARDDADNRATMPRVVVIGAGPAGLTAACMLARAGITCTVVEADDQVGGLSRTVNREGWLFDIGGHRFFTKVPEVERLWVEILGEKDFLTRPRLSRIYYRGKMFDYPLRAFNALSGLGIVETIRCVASYVWAHVHPPRSTAMFEGWVISRFGRRLYSIFFKSYTEKVWGMPAASIPADWAVQRIKNLSLLTAVLNALLPSRHGPRVTSLIEEFKYPRRGPGMMWERAQEIVERAGSEVRMSEPVRRVIRDPGTHRATAVETAGGTYPADEVISSMPLSELILAMDPPAPPEVQAAARALAYRDFLTVAMVVPGGSTFPDNWIYIHDPGVHVGRIQNFGNWSPEMVQDGGTCLGLEYFVSEGDELWSMADDDLVRLAADELDRLGLVKRGGTAQGYVVRMRKAYPVYDSAYQAHVGTIRAWLDRDAVNVHPVGRNGMHRYNNQDHSMVTAMITVGRILGQSDRDVWSVNVDDEYQEEIVIPTSPPVHAGSRTPG